MVSEMLDRVLAYVRSVIAGEIEGDPAIGRYLLETFATSTEGLDQGSFARSLQVRSSIIVISMIVGFTDGEIGHTYDFLPGESHQIASRSIYTLTARHFLVRLPAVSYRKEDIRRRYFCCITR